MYRDGIAANSHHILLSASEYETRKACYYVSLTVVFYCTAPDTPTAANCSSNYKYILSPSTIHGLLLLLLSRSLLWLLARLPNTVSGRCALLSREPVCGAAWCCFCRVPQAVHLLLPLCSTAHPDAGVNRTIRWQLCTIYSLATRCTRTGPRWP